MQFETAKHKQYISLDAMIYGMWEHQEITKLFLSKIVTLKYSYYTTKMSLKHINSQQSFKPNKPPTLACSSSLSSLQVKVT